MFFLGGPADMRWLEVSYPSPYHKVPVFKHFSKINFDAPAKSQIEMVEYILTVYHYEDISVRLYVTQPSMDMIPMDVFMHLIEGGQYRGFDESW